MFLIDTPRFTIQPLQTEDFSLIYSLLSDPKVMRFIARGTRTKSETNDLFKKYLLHQNTFGFSLGKIIEKNSGDFVGCSGLFHLALDDSNPEIELSYMLNPQYWGKGIATETAHACLNWAFKNLNVDKIIGVTDPENQASQHVLQKIGMAPKGPHIYKGTTFQWFERKTPEKIQLFETSPEDFTPKVEIAACYIIAEDELLLVKRAVGKPEECLWGVPAGKIDPGETPFEGAQRELHEETRLQFKPNQFIHQGVRYIRKPSCDYLYHMYLVILEKKPLVSIGDEHLQYCWIDPALAHTLPLMAGAEQALSAGLNPQ